MKRNGKVRGITMSLLILGMGCCLAALPGRAIAEEALPAAAPVTTVGSVKPPATDSSSSTSPESPLTDETEPTTPAVPGASSAPTSAPETAAAEVAPSTTSSDSTPKVVTGVSDANGSDELPKGTAAIESGTSYSQVVDVAGGSTSDGANVQTWSSNDTPAQRWRFEVADTDESGKSWYYIANPASGKVLDVAGGRAVSGTNVQLYAKNGTSAQLWDAVRDAASGGWTFFSRLGGKLVLDIAGGGRSSGTNLWVWTSNGTSSQRFWLREGSCGATEGDEVIPDGAYSVALATDAGYALDAAGGGDANGTNVQVYRANDTNAQRFYARYSDGYYTFENVGSGLALDVSCGSPVPGTNVQLWTPNHSAGQQWSLVSSGAGYVLVNRAGGLVLDLAGNSRANGTNVDAFFSNASSAQTWHFSSCPLVEDGCYVIRSLAVVGKVLDVRGGSWSEGAQIQNYEANGTFAQKFRVRSLGDGTYEIRSINSGKWVGASDDTQGTRVIQLGSRVAWNLSWAGGLVFSWGGLSLDLAGASSANQTPLQLWKTNGSLAQAFVLRSTSLAVTGTYVIDSLLGTVVDIAGGSARNANVQTWAANGGSAQLWNIRDVGGDVVSISNPVNGRVLDVAGGSCNSGANVQVWNDNGSNAQRWRICWSDASGALEIVNVNSGLALDVAGANPNAGANLQQYARNGSSAQGWRLTASSLPGLTGTQAAILWSADGTPSPGAGLCAAWVTNVYSNAGLGYFDGDACDQYWRWCSSQSISDLRPGMIVAVPSHSHTVAGSIWGHVCIYMGDNTIHDNYYGYIRTMSFSDWIDYYGDLYEPRWGWLGGVQAA